MKIPALLFFLFTAIQAFCQGLHPADTSQSSQVYDVVQQMPEYPGGEEAMWKFIRANIKYPDSAIMHNIQGRVIMGFVVNEDGAISNIRILKGASWDLDSEAVRVLRLFPHFNPGTQDGKAVKVNFTLPLTFKMEPNPLDTIKKPPVVEQLPEFPGGDSAMKRFINKNLQYPPFARENDIMGRVVVEFSVNTDGSLSDFYFLDRVHRDLDAEALRVIKLMPRFKPAMQQGKPVKVNFYLPIIFKLATAGERSPYPEPDYSAIPLVYQKVAVMPEFPGGSDKMREFINERLLYPRNAKVLHVQGTIVISFIVNEDGHLSHFGIATGGYYSLNDEAMRVAKLLPPFKPGRKDGKPVKVIYTLPIQFKLEEPHMY